MTQMPQQNGVSPRRPSAAGPDDEWVASARRQAAVVRGVLAELERVLPSNPAIGDQLAEEVSRPGEMLLDAARLREPDHEHPPVRSGPMLVRVPQQGLPTQLRRIGGRP